VFGEYRLNVEHNKGRIIIPSVIRDTYPRINKYLLEEEGEDVIRIYFPDILDIDRYYEMDIDDPERLEFFTGKRMLNSWRDCRGRIDIDSLKSIRLTEILGSEIKPDESVQIKLVANGDHFVIYKKDIVIVEKDKRYTKKK